MNRIREIKSFAELKEFLILNKDLIKKAALPVVVAAALLVFWVFGGEDEAAPVSGAQPDAAGSEAGLEKGEGEGGGEAAEAETTDVYVDISGCVASPGVYKVEAGTRVFQVIEKAGGVTEEADTESINRAEAVYDGQKIIIYPRGEGEGGAPPATDAQGRINVNTADADLLQEIPGVGPVTAEKIIAYRTENGNFSSVEELMEISGIGEKTFAEMKDYVTV